MSKTHKFILLRDCVQDKLGMGQKYNSVTISYYVRASNMPEKAHNSLLKNQAQRIRTHEIYKPVNLDVNLQKQK